MLDLLGIENYFKKEKKGTGVWIYGGEYRVCNSKLRESRLGCNGLKRETFTQKVIGQGMCTCRPDKFQHNTNDFYGFGFV